MIRVATYNIRKCVGLDWQRRPDRIVEVLGQLRADVVALQEADRRFGERRGTLTAEDLRKHAGLRVAPIDESGSSHGWHGNAILVGENVSIKRTSRIELPSLEPRGALIVELEVNNVALRVVGAHLGLRAPDRRRQARTILDALDARGDGTPELVLADLNEWRAKAGCIPVFAERLRVTSPGNTYHASVPVAALDRVLHSPNIDLVSGGVHGSKTAQKASDHLPVWADLAPSGSEEQAGSTRQPLDIEP